MSAVPPTLVTGLPGVTQSPTRIVQQLSAGSGSSRQPAGMEVYLLHLRGKENTIVIHYLINNGSSSFQYNIKVNTHGQYELLLQLSRMLVL